MASTFFCLLEKNLALPKKIQVQLQLYSQLAAEFCGGPLGSSGVILRDKVGVEKLLSALQEHYSVAGGNDEERGETDKKEKVRSYILLIIRKFVSMVSHVSIIDTFKFKQYIVGGNVCAVNDLLSSLLFAHV